MRNEIMRVWRSESQWLVTTNSPETKRLFGTDTIPTPFLAGMSADEVIRELQELNPEAVVKLAEWAVK